MGNSRQEFKVGVFVLICLILLAVLMLQFGKGTTLLHPTYTIYLRAGNIGSLRPRASVLMSGVQVGTIADARLSPEGTNVTVALKIYKEYVIHRSARFVIEQSGFLGDQYVAIYPEGNIGPELKPGDEATTQEPFNLQEVARSASGFIQRIDETARKLNDTINDIRRLALNEQTLTNLAFTVGSFRQVSADAETTVQHLDAMISSNNVPAAAAFSNLVVFSQQLNGVAQSAQDILNTNAPELAAAIRDVHTSTDMLTNLLADVRMGHGLAGSLLSDQQLAANFYLLSSNLAVTSSNLNRFGLWRVIRGVKSEKPPPTHPPVQGRTAFQ